MTTSLSKGISVLGALAESDSPLSVRELAEITNLPKSSVHRIVIELRGAGLIESSDAGCFLGLRLFELGGNALERNHLVTLARPFMEELYDRTQRVVQLGILQGYDVMYVVRVGRQGHQLVASPVAGRIPATCAAIGKAILAFNGELTEDIIAEGLKRRTRHSLTERTLLLSSLSEVRRTGIATELEEARMGLACVASPITVDGVVRSALSITMSVAQFDPSTLGPAVRRVATQLSNELTSARQF